MKKLFLACAFSLGLVATASATSSQDVLIEEAKQVCHNNKLDESVCGLLLLNSLGMISDTVGTDEDTLAIAKRHAILTTQICEKNNISDDLCFQLSTEIYDISIAHFKKLLSNPTSHEI